MAQIPLIPMLAQGTNYVPRDMFAYLHEGEAVVPAAYNTGTKGTTIGSIYITGSNADEIFGTSLNGNSQWRG